MKEARFLVNSTAFYRRFIPFFSDIVAPILELLKKPKSEFVWNEQLEDARLELINAITSHSGIYIPKPDREFIIHVDASYVACAGLVSQYDDEGQLRLVAAVSRSFITSERNGAPVTKEILGLIYTLTSLQYILRGAKLKVFTDCRSIALLKTCATTSAYLSRLAMILSQYDFSIHHVEGRLNLQADALSRLHAKHDKILADDKTENTALTKDESLLFLEYLTIPPNYRYTIPEVRQLLTTEPLKSQLEKRVKHRYVSSLKDSKYNSPEVLKSKKTHEPRYTRWHPLDSRNPKFLHKRFTKHKSKLWPSPECNTLLHNFLNKLEKLKAKSFHPSPQNSPIHSTNETPISQQTNCPTMKMQTSDAPCVTSISIPVAFSHSGEEITFARLDHEIKGKFAANRFTEQTPTPPFFTAGQKETCKQGTSSKTQISPSELIEEKLRTQSHNQFQIFDKNFNFVLDTGNSPKEPKNSKISEKYDTQKENFISCNHSMLPKQSDYLDIPPTENIFPSKSPIILHNSSDPLADFSKNMTKSDKEHDLITFSTCPQSPSQAKIPFSQDIMSQEIPTLDNTSILQPSNYQILENFPSKNSNILSECYLIPTKQVATNEFLEETHKHACHHEKAISKGEENSSDADLLDHTYVCIAALFEPPIPVQSASPEAKLSDFSTPTECLRSMTDEHDLLQWDPLLSEDICNKPQSCSAILSAEKHFKQIINLQENFEKNSDHPFIFQDSCKQLFEEKFEKNLPDPEIANINTIFTANNCCGIHNIELKDTLADLAFKSQILKDGKISLANFSQAQLTDKTINEHFQNVKQNPDKFKHLKITQNILHRKTPEGFLPWLPKSLEPILFNSQHFHILAGHKSAKAIIQDIKLDFFVPDLKRKVQNFVKNCVICPQAKSLRMQQSFQGTTLTATRPKQYMSFDIFSGLPENQDGYKYVLTFIDNFSLFVICIKTKQKDMKTLHSAFMQVFAIWSQIPEIVFSDEETALTLAESHDFFKSLDITHKQGSAHAHWRLLSEVGAVKKIKQFLRSILLSNPQLSWEEALHFATIAANNTPTIYKYTPFHLFYGVKNNKNKLISASTQCTTVDEYLETLKTSFNEIVAKVNAQRKQFKAARTDLINKHRASKEFQVNDLVWLKGLNISPNKAVKIVNQGPYKILEKDGTHNYKLARLSNPQNCFKIAHASFLEKYKNNVDLSPINFPRISIK